MHWPYMGKHSYCLSIYMRFLSQSSWINLSVTLLSNFQSSLSENMEFFWLDGGTVLLLIQIFCLSQLQKRNPRTILSTVCFHFSETKDKGKERKGKFAGRNRQQLHLP